MFDKYEILNSQVHTVKDFLVHYSSYRMLLNNFDDLSNNNSREFWVHTINAHYYQAINLWCMVFGTDSNEIHWKKLELEQSLKPLILSKLDISDKAFSDYWTEVKDWRNTFSAHRLPDVSLPKTPELKMARNIITVYENWLKDYDLIGFSFEQYENIFREKVEHVIKEVLK